MRSNKVIIVNVTVRTERVVSVSVKGDSDKINLIHNAARREAIGYCAELNRKIGTSLSPKQISSYRNNLGRKTE